jgi:hypothetical protein
MNSTSTATATAAITTTYSTILQQQMELTVRIIAISPGAIRHCFIDDEGRRSFYLRRLSPKFY